MDRQKEIHDKGFVINTKYGTLINGGKLYEDSTLLLPIMKDGKVCGKFTKKEVADAFAENDIERIRKISQYFYNISGIYKKSCQYLAYLYRYDWYIVPEVMDDDAEQEKMLVEFNKMLNFLDNSHIKKLCGKIALDTIVNGAFYGYITLTDNKVIIQDLPIKYCRSRFNINGNPAVEFNMQYFDDCFKDLKYKLKVLSIFPPEFLKGYQLYKQKKLESDIYGEYGSWYLLDPDFAFKINLNNSDIPFLSNAIPAIINLYDAQYMDKRKQAQQLLKLLVQKLPTDKNGDLIFDNDEARDIHRNAVQMLQGAIGAEIITTFADIDVHDMSDNNSTQSDNYLDRVKNNVYDNFGMSRNLFNTDGNLSLEKSIANDESTMRDLILQFHILFDNILKLKGTKWKKYSYRLYMLETTQYNYQNLAKIYKEQVTNGYSKMLPQIALGHSQSSILHSLYFENSILNLVTLMVPPISSNTMSSEDISAIQKGRPELDESQKSDKTIANQESQN